MFLTWNNKWNVFIFEISQRAFLYSEDACYSALFKMAFNMTVYNWSKICILFESMFVFTLMCACARKLKPLIQPLCGHYSEASRSHSYWITDIRSDNPWLEIFAIALNAVRLECE